MPPTYPSITLPKVTSDMTLGFVPLVKPPETLLSKGLADDVPGGGVRGLRIKRL
jgi:hypothetical protein